MEGEKGRKGMEKGRDDGQARGGWTGKDDLHPTLFYALAKR